MHSNSYQLVRAFAVVIRYMYVPKSKNNFYRLWERCKNISTKQYRLGQYKVTTINLFKKQRPTKISQFSLKPTQINTRKRKAVWNKNQINSFGTLI